MTIGDYIKGKFKLWSVDYSDDLIEAELSLINLISFDVFTGEINLDLFFYNVIPDILLLPNSLSEGGYSISYDKNAMINYYSILSKQLGKENLLLDNKITNKSNIW